MVPRLSVGLLLAAVLGLSLAGAPRNAMDHDELGVILADTVRAGRVDYGRIRTRHSAPLNRYLERMARADLSSLGRSEQLAVYINLYNASVLRVVAERYEPDYTVQIDDFKIFDEPLVRLGERTFSLNHLEHEIIRARFEEPRVHVALVCAARSCPALLSRAYEAADLEETLEANMKRFLGDTERNRIRHDVRRLELSRIFEWFADDFGGREALASYVDRYTEKDVTGYEVSFLEYSWQLNSATSPD